MTPVQEIANALTMLLPTILLAHQSAHHGNHWVYLLLLGSCMHLPVSCTYHLSAAFGRYTDPIDNDMRRLDQTLQHVVCVLYSYALSNGSVGYMLLNLVVNTRGVVRLWDPSTSNDKRRWRPIFVSGVLYLVPILAKGEVLCFSIAFLAFLLGGTAAFVLNRSGYGSVILHLLMVVHAYALVKAVWWLDLWLDLLCSYYVPLKGGMSPLKVLFNFF